MWSKLGFEQWNISNAQISEYQSALADYGRQLKGESIQVELAVFRLLDSVEELGEWAQLAQLVVWVAS